MILKRLFGILLIGCFGFAGFRNQAYAQRENIWTFGTRAGIDFNSGTPMPFITKMPYSFPYDFFYATMNWPSASVCDTNGKFLFYTDGAVIYNRIYDTMPNGTWLLPGMDTDFCSRQLVNLTDQGPLIVPMPDSADKYYVFSLTSQSICTGSSAFQAGDLQGVGRLYYSIVDMRLDSGRGDVVPSMKGIFVDSNLQEKLVSVVGDRCNIWVLTCGWDARFRAYEITSSGINTIPVVSAVGNGNFAAAKGMIAVAPNRKKIAASQFGAVQWSFLPKDENGNPKDWAELNTSALELYDFDPASGIVSNPVMLMPYYTPSAYSNPGSGFVLSGLDSCARPVCFSPDGSKLYASTGNWMTSLNPNSKLLQFDLSSGDPTIMANSRTFIAYVRTEGHIKVAPNGKIYLGSPNSGTLEGINAPNQPGTACQYVSNAITLDSGSSWFMQLPNIISELKRDTTYVTRSIAVCDVLDSMQIRATDTSGWDYIWNDSSYGIKHSITQSGTYWLQYHTPPCVFHTDTFMITIGNLHTPVITVNNFDLSTAMPYDTYQWYLNGKLIPGATNRVYTVTENGDYTVMVSDKKSGCIATSIVYKVTNVPNDIKNAGSLQPEIKIYPNPANDVIYIQSPIALNINITDIEGRTVKKAMQAEKIDLKDLAKGAYLIHIYNQDGNFIKVSRLIHL